MNFENPQSTEQPFNKSTILKNINLIIEEMEDRQIDALGEVPADAAIFYQNIKNLTDSVLRESKIIDRESFIRALEYRKQNGEDQEIIDFIIKNTRD